MRVLATLEALRDQVRDEILKDPRYLTYQALERSIEDLKVALQGTGPSASFELRPVVFARPDARSETADAAASGAADHLAMVKPNGGHGPAVIIHPSGDIGRAELPQAIADGLPPANVCDRSAAGHNREPQLTASANGRAERSDRPLTTQVDSEAMANLQHALIDLINGDHSQCAEPAQDDDRQIG